MNIFVENLSTGSPGQLDHHKTKLVVEDNVGESIHIHYRDVRFEMSIDDFLVFASEMKDAADVFRDGDY